MTKQHVISFAIHFKCNKMKLLKNLQILSMLVMAVAIISCEGPEGAAGPAGTDGANGTNGTNGTDGSDGEDLINPELLPLEASKTPNLLLTESEFSDLGIEVILSSEDTLPSVDFVYGSMADGAGLLKNFDGSYTLINNIEADYSIARITLNSDFRPINGEYILNAVATGFTAQCSGSMITQEEHGFGPLYLSGGEWGGDMKGVFVTDPYRSATLADNATLLTAFGQWSTENAVVIGKDAYADKTVAFIGDDDSDNETPQGHLGMYVGDRGDLLGGDLYILRVKDTANIKFEMDMTEGSTYDAEWVKMSETEIDALNQAAMDSLTMGFSRLEDIDWRRGSAENEREIYMAVTGRKKDGLVGKGTIYGRVYKVELDDTDPTGDAKITCVLDGDKLDGVAKQFHSPDNILVTENYAYIQEDPNGYPDTNDKAHYAYLYQYDLNTGDLKVVLSADQDKAEGLGYGPTTRTWEITGMIDVTDVMKASESTFILITQNHGWERESGVPFTDPHADPRTLGTRAEGSVLYKITGLAR